MEKLVLNEVFKNYGSVEAVRRVSFSIKENEFVTIVGPSGCGKSSTLRMIAGLEAVTKGEILLDGVRINDIRARNRDIALAFESYALYPHMTASQNLAFPLQTKRMKRQEISTRVEEILRLLNLTRYRNAKPSELSGGQQQRISLGRALIRQASIYLLDEPLSHLDAQEKVELRVQLQRIQKLRGLTFILVTHDQFEALEMSDRIIVMNEGRIQQIGTPEELYNDPANLFVADFIGEPPMNFIHGTLRKNSKSFILSCRGGNFELPQSKVSSLGEYADTPAIVGIRPTYIKLCGREHPRSIGAEIFSYENMGELGYLLVECNGERLLIEDEGGRAYTTGEKISFCFESDRVCVFSEENGKRLM
jgi:multiple sugar transport system ATP-binding protein